MQSIINLVVVMFSMAFASGANADEFQWRFSSDKITLEQWTEFRSEVLAMPGLERQEFANQLVLISTQERRIYVFTQPLHPAYPAVVVRAVVERGKESDVQRMGHYAGDVKAFETWWHEFDALDARIPGQAR